MAVAITLLVHQSNQCKDKAWQKNGVSIGSMWMRGAYREEEQTIFAVLPNIQDKIEYHYFGQDQVASFPDGKLIRPQQISMNRCPFMFIFPASPFFLLFYFCSFCFKSLRCPSPLMARREIERVWWGRKVDWRERSEGRVLLSPPFHTVIHPTHILNFILILETTLFPILLLVIRKEGWCEMGLHHHVNNRPGVEGKCWSWYSACQLSSKMWTWPETQLAHPGQGGGYEVLEAAV